MTQTPHSLRNSGSAIAAALALVSTPGLAQDAAGQFPAAPAAQPVPEIVVPEIPTPTAPEPTVVLPAEAPAEPPLAEPAASTPDPEPAQAPAAARTRAAPPSAQEVPVPEPAREASPVAPAAEAGANDQSAVPPVAPVETDLQPPLETEQPATGAVDTGILAIMLGGLVFLALAIWGFIAIGRRKPVRRYAAVAPQPVARAAAVAEPAPNLAAEQAPIDARPARPVAVEPLVTPAPSAGLPHAGASVALPRRLPESYEEREALFWRMVEARPDRANPFSDRKARMKRARLIMQSIGRDFGDAEPWIDLSQYPHNWPELAARRSAAA